MLGNKEVDLLMGKEIKRHSEVGEGKRSGKKWDALWPCTNSKEECKPHHCKHGIMPCLNFKEGVGWLQEKGENMYGHAVNAWTEFWEMTSIKLVKFKSWMKQMLIKKNNMKSARKFNEL